MQIVNINYEFKIKMRARTRVRINIYVIYTHAYIYIHTCTHVRAQYTTYSIFKNKFESILFYISAHLFLKFNNKYISTSVQD